MGGGAPGLISGSLGCCARVAKGAEKNSMAESISAHRDVLLARRRRGLNGIIERGMWISAALRSFGTLPAGTHNASSVPSDDAIQKRCVFRFMGADRSWH